MISKFRAPFSKSMKNRKSSLKLEQLECRRLLAGDGAIIDPPFPDFGSVQGVKWNDLDGNGTREDNEPGLAGVIIYADTNENGIWEDFEPATRTRRDDPDTPEDETGQYLLEHLPLGEYVIREVVPDGFVQTFPRGVFGGIDEDGQGDEFSTTFPDAIHLQLAAGEEAVETVGIQIHPFCVRPVPIEVVASDPDVQFHNRSDVILNGCGGEESIFEVSIVGDGQARKFDVRFLDAETGDIINSIPVLMNADGAGSGHRVIIEPQSHYEGLDFGNQGQQNNQGAVAGRKWNDLNGNGLREENEPGLAGVVIYADVNNNGIWEDFEPVTRTRRDDPNTRADETGQYLLDGLAPGEYVIREVVPDGFVQTFPRRVVGGIDPDGQRDDFSTTFPDEIHLQLVAGEEAVESVGIQIHPFCFRPVPIDVVASDPDVQFHNQSGVILNGCAGEESLFEVSFVGDGHAREFEVWFMDAETGDVIDSIPVFMNTDVAGGGHHVVIQPESHIEGLDFGNQWQRNNGAAIEGRKWNDANGNGVQDGNETGLGGVVIYLDQNRNGRFDRFEPFTETLHDDPFTDFDEGGLYVLSGLAPGEYVVREIVPEGFEQTFPSAAAAVISSETGSFEPGIAIDLDVTGIHFHQPANQSETSLELTVIWPDTCGTIVRDAANHTIIGDHILVEMYGRQEGDACAEVITEETQAIEIFGLERGGYTVVATLHEELRDGSVAATLGVVGQVRIGGQGQHVVQVEAGQSVTDINFGNRQIGPGASVHGTKWLDENGNGRRDRGEPGLAGVTIYSDLNRNGQLDDNEPSTRTMADDPNTPDDETGHYWLEGLAPRRHFILEVVPDGFQQTFPPEVISIPLPGDPIIERWHLVTLAPGQTLEGIDFGNQRMTPGSIHGTKWLDENGDGVRDPGEVGLAGVTIFADVNHNGQFDEDDPHTVTMEDIPETDFDEGGMYWLEGLDPGDYAIYEVLPDGFMQTHPVLWPPVPFGGPIPGPHFVTVVPGGSVEGIDFGNQKIEPGSIHGTKWLDENGNGQRDDGEPGLPGVTIYVDLNHNWQFDADEPHTVTMEDDPDTDFDESGMYWLDGLDPGWLEVREVIPDGFIQTFPPAWDFFGNPDIQPPADIPFPSGQHFVQLGSGQTVEGIDFGNQRIEPSSIHGTKWLDENGNGQRDDGEPGLAGVTIYVDLNANGVLDENEPHTVTMEDDPDTDFDESGMYWLENVPAGVVHVREVVPDGFEQTFPPSWLMHGDIPFGGPVAPPFFGDAPHVIEVGNGVAVEGIDFGNRKIEPGSIHGLKWNDANGNGIIDDGEKGIAGVTIFLDTNFNGILDDTEPFTVTMEDDPETDVDETGYYWLENVQAGFHAVGEVVPDGFVQTYPQGFGIPFPFPIPPFDPVDPLVLEGQHTVFVGPGDTIEGINFGNREQGPLAAIAGVKWHDRNGNSQRDANEEGIAGVRIFADMNLNGRFDRNEPHAFTAVDNPDTEVDETGQYTLELPAGTHLILETVPDGFEQIFPSPHRRVRFPFNLGHSISLEPNQVLDGVNFGNRAHKLNASIKGVKWVDRDGDGRRSDDEPGLAGVTIFSDLNLNGELDRGEPHAITQRDNPSTPEDETGSYELRVSLGDHLILEVSPRGMEQTHPNPAREITFPFNLGHRVTVSDEGEVIEGIDFGNRRAEQPAEGAIVGRHWIDVNANGRMEADEAGHAGVRVYLDLNNNGQLDDREPTRITQRDNPNTRFDESGRFEFGDLRPGRYVVRQVVPEGFQQTFPSGGVELGETFSVNLPDGGAIGFDLIDVAQSGADVEMTFEVVWPNGCGELKDVDWHLSADGDMIRVNVFGEYFPESGFCTDEEKHETITVNVGTLPSSDYAIRGVLHEVIFGDILVESFVVESKMAIRGDGAHVVELRSGRVVDGVNFGNTPKKNVPHDLMEAADFNDDEKVDAADIDRLAAALRNDETESDFDLNQDGVVDHADVDLLVEGALESTYGDSNLDGLFDSKDLVLVFQRGEFEDGIAGNSGWEDGDWNGDGDFGTADLVYAFQKGGYQRGAVNSELAAAIDKIWGDDRADERRS